MCFERATRHESTKTSERAIIQESTTEMEREPLE
jgi:hypothetical protein